MLSRPQSSSSKELPEGANIASVDFTDLAALSAVFQKYSIEVVISTVGSGGLAGQKVLGDAAKQGGVKLFIPSEFGFDTIGATEGLFGLKEGIANHLKSIGLPSIRVIVSQTTPHVLMHTHRIWTEWSFDPVHPMDFCHWNWENTDTRYRR